MGYQMQRICRLTQYIKPWKWRHFIAWGGGGRGGCFPSRPCRTARVTAGGAELDSAGLSLSVRLFGKGSMKRESRTHSDHVATLHALVLTYGKRKKCP